jgi:hypothetical protein
MSSAASSSTGPAAIGAQRSGADMRISLVFEPTRHVTDVSQLEVVDYSIRRLGADT